METSNVLPAAGSLFEKRNLFLHQPNGRNAGDQVSKIKSCMVCGYIFTIIQLRDYSLLMGSIGLFIALGIIMYFSGKLQW